MDSSEVGCILAGAAAIALISAQSSRSRVVARGSKNYRYPQRSASACQAMRAKHSSLPSPPPYASAKVSDMVPQSAALTEDINNLYTSENEQSNSDHLAKQAKHIAQKSTYRRSIQPIQEIGTSKADKVLGRFTTRLGDPQWEHGGFAPKQTQAVGVGLPMNDFQVDKYTEQFGEFTSYGDYSGGTDPHDGLFDSVMGGGGNVVSSAAA